MISSDDLAMDVRREIVDVWRDKRRVEAVLVPTLLNTWQLAWCSPWLYGFRSTENPVPLVAMNFFAVNVSHGLGTIYLIIVLADDNVLPFLWAGEMLSPTYNRATCTLELLMIKCLILQISDNFFSANDIIDSLHSLLYIAYCSLLLDVIGHLYTVFFSVVCACASGTILIIIIIIIINYNNK